MNRFHFVPFGLPEESPTSIIKRFGLAHGCLNSKSLSHLVGRECSVHPSLTQTNKFTRDIANLLHPREEEFTCGFYSPADGSSKADLKIQGLYTPIKLIRLRGAAFCSRCSAEGYEHFLKDIKLTDYCPLHQCDLLRQCSACGVALKWLSPFTNFCKCGAALECIPCSRDDCATEARLLEIYRTRDEGALRELYKILKELGYTFPSGPNTLEQREIIKAAFSALDKSISGITNYLYLLKSLYPSIDKNILAAKINRLTPAELRKSAIECFIVNPSPPFPAENLVPEREFSLNKTQLSRLCRIDLLNASCQEWFSSHPKDYRNWQYNIGEIHSLLKFISDKHLTLTNRAISHREDFYNTKETIQILGITYPYLRELVRSGHLIRYHPNSVVAYRREEVNEIHNKFDSAGKFALRLNTTIRKLRASVDNQLTSEDYLPTPLAVQLYSKNFVDRMIKSALELQYCKPSIRKHALSLTILAEYDPSQYLRIDQMAVNLNFFPSSIRYYIHNGLVSVAARGKYGKWLIAIEEVKRFDMKYISANAAATLLKISYFKIVDFLAHHGVDPVEMKKRPDTVSRLYLRSDINRTLTTCISKAPPKLSKLLTRSDACERLRISNSTLTSLELAGAFPGSFRHSVGNSFLEKDIEHFGEHYVRLHHIALFFGCGPANALKSLNKFGINPVCGPMTNSSSVTFFKVSDLAIFDLTAAIANSFHCSLISNETPAPQTRSPSCTSRASLVPVADILSRFDLSPSAFTRLFISSGFVSPLIIKQVKYLFQSEASVINEILSNHYTYSGAEKILGRRKTRLLIATGTLELATLSDPKLASAKFIRRSDILNFLSTKI